MTAPGGHASPGWPGELTELLAGLGRETTARIRRAIKPLALGPQQYVVLSQVRELGQPSQVELAAALRLNPSNLATTIGELVERGLIDRSRDDEDRRRYVLGLTPAGEQLREQAAEVICDSEADLLAGLDGAQIEQLRGLLRRVGAGVDLCPAPDDPDCLE